MAKTSTIPQFDLSPAKAQLAVSKLFASCAVVDHHDKIKWQDADVCGNIFLCLLVDMELSDLESVATLNLLRDEHGLDGNFHNGVLREGDDGVEQLWDLEAFCMDIELPLCALWFLDHCGGNPNAETPDRTPLIHLAPLHFVSEFLDRGAKAVATDAEARTWMHKLPFQKWSPDVSALAQRLLSEGVSLNDQDDNGFTPLHVAARTGAIECVEWMLENGADLNLRAHRKTASDLAAAAGHATVVNMLRARALAVHEHAELEAQKTVDTARLAEIGRVLSLLALEGRLALDGKPLDESALVALTDTKKSTTKNRIRI